jgi:hypothetical protein
LGKSKAGHWWLTSAVLAIWEAEMGKIEVQDQTKQKVQETVCQTIAECLAYICHPKLYRKLRSGGLQFQASLDKVKPQYPW